jgi:nickel-type superoxide dismutase maturation protease
VRRSRWWAVEVRGDSMAPTLCEGDWLLARRTTRVRPGDLVVLARPDRPNLLVVKRLIRRDETGWWVEGDNPAASDDSRLFGPVPEVLARVVLRYAPRPRLLRPGHLRPSAR